MASNPLVSLIVPVYNSIEYLDRCLKSLVEQNYKNVEILLIDDGSTDGSDSLCNSWVIEDSRVRVFHTQNKGPSYARNIGISASRSEYLMFVDSDDWLDLDAVQLAIRTLLMDNADLVCFDFYPCNQLEVVSRSLVVPRKMPDILTSTGTECLGFIYSQQLGNFSWQFLYRKDVFVGKKVMFPTYTYILEDVVMVNMLLRVVNRVVYIHKPLYAYNQSSSGSLTKSSSLSKAKGGFEAVEYVSTLDIPRCQKRDFYNYLIDLYFFILSISVNIQSSDGKEFRSKLKKQVVNASSEIGFRNLTRENSIKMFLLRMGLYNFALTSKRVIGKFI